MRFGKPASPKTKAPSRPPVRAGGQKSSQAQAILDDGETRGAVGKMAASQAGLGGRVSGRALGTTGKGAAPTNLPPARPPVPRGGTAGLGILPGIAGPAMPAPRPTIPLAPRPATTPSLAIGQRPRLGARTLNAMKQAKAPRRPKGLP